MSRGKPQKYFWNQKQDELIVKHYDSRTATIDALAKAFNVPRWALRKRAQELGVARTKEAVWSEEDIQILEKNYGRMSKKKLAKMLGRTLTALTLKLKRLGIKKTQDGYTLRGVCDAFGVDHHKVEKWVANGWLKIRGRGVIRPQGDFWFVTDEALRKFIKAHPEEIDLRRVEKLWFIDLLTKGLNVKVSDFDGVEDYDDAYATHV